MNLENLKKYKFPNSPGVYFFKKKSKILYIGKATSLKDRIRSYFSNDLIKTRGPAIVDMITISDKIVFKKTDSVLEALILESNLIKKHKPKYNIKEKDDKSYNYVVITEEKIPRILVLRQRELKYNLFDFKIKKSFGPFVNAGQLKQALKIIQRIFPFFDNQKPIEKFKDLDKKRINLNFEIGIYPNIFEDKNSLKKYQKNIKNIILFFEGKKKKIISNLKKQMSDFSRMQEFEKAQNIKNTIFALGHINDISLISEDFSDLISSNKDFFRIESYDVSHTSGDQSVGVMVVYQNNSLQKNLYRKFIIKNENKNDDYAALKEIITRRLNHSEWIWPNLIIIDGGIGQKNIAQNVIDEIYKNQNDKKPKIVSVVKNDKHAPKEILGDKNLVQKYKNLILQINQETHRFAISFHRKRRSMLK
ncbi:MAG TPA: GIY-YIG nuclease family protein [Candidatus Paceibacterota bacterium]|nr:GIY-YIG nuclease family protein [Candidatus Paceibacterota bacterium]HMP18782.1 GIY-YIG nuclease family protein [Candidatus Paceibacterota bacterium]HMP85504.1 GIY-YIG nuclease family protein [Candidatus Paceibacterota bacterium]